MKEKGRLAVVLLIACLIFSLLCTVSYKYFKKDFTQTKKGIIEMTK
jgi:hypothetical protein